jgi:hypothetical protein
VIKCAAPPRFTPQGLRHSITQPRRIVAGALFREARYLRRGEAITETNAADIANVSRQGKRTDLLDNNESDIQEVKAPTGTSRAAFLRRLRRDRPDIHARVTISN